MIALSERSSASNKPYFDIMDYNYPWLNIMDYEEWPNTGQEILIRYFNYCTSEDDCKKRGPEYLIRQDIVFPIIKEETQYLSKYSNIKTEILSINKLNEYCAKKNSCKDGEISLGLYNKTKRIILLGIIEKKDGYNYISYNVVLHEIAHAKQEQPNHDEDFKNIFNELKEKYTINYINSIYGEKKMIKIIQDPIEITDLAASKAEGILRLRGMEEAYVRVFVIGGGCSGYQYGMSLSSEAELSDIIIEKNGVKFLIDSDSEPYIRGARIDYIDDIMKQGFDIQNPNAVMSCACGTSFDVADKSGAQQAKSCV